MIGGFLYSKVDRDIDSRLGKKLNNSSNKIIVWDNGYLFFDEPFKDYQTPYINSDELIALSQDFLVAEDSGGDYKPLDLQSDFPDMFLKKQIDAFNLIVSDFCMVVVHKTNKGKTAFLVSNRAGSGRIFYHRFGSGIIFSSHLRFLLKIIPLDVSKIGIYSILKYGAISEPMTISNNISAIPPAYYMNYDLKSNKYFAMPYFKFKFASNDSENSHNNNLIAIDRVKHILQKSSKFLNKYQPAILMSGGIDSSLYASYLNEASKNRLHGIYCAFGEIDPELQFAKMIAEQINARLHVGKMMEGEAIGILEDVVRLTGHPFSDFSSLPIVFILKYIKEHLTEQKIIIECNGGDDCFGFSALNLQSKYVIKHIFPIFFKNLIGSFFKNAPYWKWESHEGWSARLLALADVHEINPLNYFLVLAPVNYLGLKTFKEWDKKLATIMDNVFSSYGEDYSSMDFRAKITIRQLMHTNSRRWAAKALSVGESLGFRLIYPYIWHEVLIEQGKLPWTAKIHNGIVKWPLKKLLEEYMPKSFIYRKKSGFVPPFARWLTSRDFNYKIRDILFSPKAYIAEIVPRSILDELLSDALNEKNLRHSVLNFLWGAIFTEMWIQKYK